jgi:hypothetical protein
MILRQDSTKTRVPLPISPILPDSELLETASTLQQVIFIMDCDLILRQDSFGRMR